MIKIFLQAFILRSGGGERVRPIITTFLFEIMFCFVFFFTKLTLFGEMKGSNSNNPMGLCFCFCFSFKGSPLSLSLAWHFGARETHIMSIKRDILASCPHWFLTSIIGLVFMHLSCIGIFLFKIKRKHMSLQMTKFH